MRPPADKPPGGIPYAPRLFIYPSKNPYIFIPAVLMHFDAATGIHQALAHLSRVDTFAHALGQSEMDQA
jgi:hypothetical protein